jgi:glucosamine--fructose-6-phosphate aminotransferase (isomerizing)
LFAAGGSAIACGTAVNERGFLMLQDTRQQILNLPNDLREMLEKGWSEWGEVVRGTRWGEVPIYLVAAGPSYAVGLAGAYAFESLLGWPTVVRTAEELRAYTQSALRPRSILIVLSWEGSAKLLEVVRAAKARAAIVLALTCDAQSPLAKAADGVLLVHGEQRSEDDISANVCQLAAVHGIALVAVKTLKRPSPQIQTLEREFPSLPAHVEWVLTQLTDAVQSLAAELSGPRTLSVVAGGCYYPAALLAASVLRRLGKLRVQVLTCDELEACRTETLDPAESLLVLSGSRCRVKKPLHALIGRLSGAGVKVLAVTDHNEPEVTRRAALTVLLPNLSEPVGSIVAVTLLDWVAYHLASQGNRKGKPSQRI